MKLLLPPGMDGPGVVPSTCGARIVATGSLGSLIDVDTGHLILQSRAAESAQHLDDFVRALA